MLNYILELNVKNAQNFQKRGKSINPNNLFWCINLAGGTKEGGF